MKLDSRECRLILEKMIPETAMEWLAIKVLLVDEKEAEKVVDIPGIQELSHAQLDLLTYNIRKIRERIGIEDEA